MDFRRDGQALPGRFRRLIALLLPGRLVAAELFPRWYHEENAT
jgi:hypothetical protein